MSLRGQRVSRRPGAARTPVRMCLSALLIVGIGAVSGVGDIAVVAGPAYADPPVYPSAGQVNRSKAAAHQALASLAAAQHAVDVGTAAVDAAHTASEIALERWGAATSDLAKAQADAATARAVADRATQAADAAQGQVDQWAVTSYQFGGDMAGGLGSWAAMLDSAFTSQGVQGLLDRTTSVQQVAQSRRSGLADAADARLHALQAQLAATAATEEQQVRQAAVADAARIAKAAEAAATTQLRALAASSARVNAQLVAARAQVARLVSSRAAGLAAVAAARAAARRARLAAEARAKAAAAAAASGGGSGIHHDPDTNGQAWPTGGSYTTPAQRRGAVAYARAQLGDPYVAFADGPDAFDCSGLTSAAYRSVGFVMDHYSQYQFATGRKIPVSQLQPGDLVYFATDPSNWRTIHHVGIYAGGGQMIEAPHTGDVVKYWTIWQDELVGFGTRP